MKENTINKIYETLFKINQKNNDIEKEIFQIRMMIENLQYDVRKKCENDGEKN